MKEMKEKWLYWASEMQAIGQIGLTYCKDIFDKQRYERLMSLAAEIMAQHSELSQSAIEKIFANEAGYATPKVDIRAVIFRDEKILLVQERSDNLWSLPGGWADINHTPSECAIAEVEQETGFKAKVVKLLGLYDLHTQAHPTQWPHLYKAFFLCEIIGGEARPSIETHAVEFFARDALPPLSKSRVMPHQIERFFEHYHHPNWPTDFD